MPNLAGLVAAGDRAALVPSFPCVTCPVQANMTTGKLPAQHGVVANGFYWPDQRDGGRDVDRLERRDPRAADLGHSASARSASCARPFGFRCWQRGPGPMDLHARADPQSRRLRIALVLHAADRTVWRAARRAGAFSAAAFLGPAGQYPLDRLDRRFGRPSGERERPNFFYIYLPHLDYAAQKFGPDSPEAQQALADLDGALGG